MEITNRFLKAMGLHLLKYNFKNIHSGEKDFFFLFFFSKHADCCHLNVKYLIDGLDSGFMEWGLNKEIVKQIK